MLPVNVMSEILLISVLILEKRVPAISRFIVRLFCAFAEIKINEPDGLNYWAIRVLVYAICHPFNCDNAGLIYRIKHFFIC